MHPDNGTQRYFFHDNVFKDMIQPACLISLGAYMRKGDHRVENNYANTKPPLFPQKGLAPGCTFKDNVEVKDNQWPEAARKIIESAGLEPAYKDLLKTSDSNEAL